MTCAANARMAAERTFSRTLKVLDACIFACTDAVQSAGVAVDSL